MAVWADCCDPNTDPSAPPEPNEGGLPNAGGLPKAGAPPKAGDDPKPPVFTRVCVIKNIFLLHPKFSYSVFTEYY